MLRVLHSAFFVNAHDGINRQMDAEQAAANSLHFAWRCAVFTVSPHQHSLSINRNKHYINRFVGRFAYYKWLYRELKKYDVLVLRYAISDPIQPFFIWLLNKPVYLVHHTLEVPQVSMYKGPFTVARICAEKIFGKLSLYRATGLICVTREIANYELGRVQKAVSRIHIYPNGLVFKEGENKVAEQSEGAVVASMRCNHSLQLDNTRIKSVRSEEKITAGLRCKPIELLFVASLFIEWHGLDKLIEAAIVSDKLFVIHVVGEVGDADLHAKAKACAKILLHGNLSHTQISELEKQCDVGLGSFALERKGMVEACPLKVRGYLAAGLPVYAGHADVFPDNFRFYKAGPCNIDNIIDFAEITMTSSKQEVSQMSRQYIDKKVILAELYRFLESQESSAQ